VYWYSMLFHDGVWIDSFNSSFHVTLQDNVELVPALNPLLFFLLHKMLNYQTKGTHDHVAV